MHSLFHSIEQARCKKNWQEMEGSDRVKLCPECGTVAFQVDGLSEQEARQMIVAVRGHDQPLHNLFRRYDGTIVCDNAPCGVFAGRQYWSDWLLSLRFVVVTIIRSPLSIMATLVACIFPVAFTWLIPLGVVVGTFDAVVIYAGVSLSLYLFVACRIARSYARSLGMQTKDSRRDAARHYYYACLNFIMYYGLVWAGLVLVIFPGIFLAARACLGLVLICVENRNPVAALQDSIKLTKGYAGEVVWNTTAAFTACVMAIVLALFLGGFLFLPFSVGFVFALTFIPLQVNLYRRLKTRRAALASPLLAIGTNEDRQPL